MNPLPPTGRENNILGAYRLISRISIFIIAAIAVFSWIWIKPAPAVESGHENGMVIMILWYVMLVIAVGSILLNWKTPSDLDAYRRKALTAIVSSILIAVIGLVTAFLSSDKFDAIRAVIISLLLMVTSFPRRAYSNRMQF